MPSFYPLFCQHFSWVSVQNPHLIAGKIPIFPPLVGPSTMSQPENLRFPGRCSPATAPWWRDRCAHCARPHWATARAWSIQRRPAIGRPPSLRSVDLKNQGLTTDQQPITIENLWKMWFNITVHLKQRNKVIHY